jgi:hypothetical protein
MYSMHPNTYLEMIEQDRERAMIQRALERAARSGGAQRPGLIRGGLTSFARLARQAGVAVTSFHLGAFGGTSPVAGSSSH